MPRRFLLLQIRDPGDPMAEHERQAFCSALGIGSDQLEVSELTEGAPSAARIAAADMVLIGGSGQHSVAEGKEAPWLPGALRAMEQLHETGKPTFASCWGFQAMARALGGRVVRDPDLAELGVLPLRLTEEGLRDPVFSELGDPFRAVMGHEDSVVELPSGAVCLAFSSRVRYLAFRFEDRPIYGTQFHPELDLEGLLTRIRRYPRYQDLGLHESGGPSPGTLTLVRRVAELLLSPGQIRSSFA